MDVVAHLTDGAVSAVFVGDGGMPCLAHWGVNLDTPPPADAFERPIANGLDVDAVVGLVVESSTGWFGRPGLEGCRPGGSDHATRFELSTVTGGDDQVVFELCDPIAELDLRIVVSLCPGPVLAFDASLTNRASRPYRLDALRVSLPVPHRAREILTLGGRWGHEFLPQRTTWEQNCVVVENRHGKTSHERLPLAVVGTPAFTEASGEVWACHLAWSGNYELVCDAQTDAHRVLQAGELLASGEIELGPGESYAAPTLLAAWSADGLNGLSNRFHRYFRSRPSHPTSPRLVGLNVWEAVYFDHDLDRLRGLADRAAALGVERFVLDDGWFHGRRDDHAGLGDWWCDAAVWPDGLSPLADHVGALGMQFGIWVEPEMVNPDSDLYRAHPEWALVDHRRDLVLGRNQLVLDLGRNEVRDYLFDHLHRLLSDHDIGYVKWDHNRDLVSPVSRGRAGVHAQTLGLYELLARLRDAHPGVEFETCASGGGRVDAGILQFTDRVWASDSIDALDRHAIQRGFSLLFPPELMGTHVGSPVCHMTGRRHSLAFRATTALFGSMGVEWNLLDASADELKMLSAAIDLHKRLRPVLHSGDAIRIDHPDQRIDAHGVIASDRSMALVAVTRLANGPSQHSPAVRVPGLDEHRTYCVTDASLDGSHRGPGRRAPSWLATGIDLTGAQLAAIGLHLPVLQPESTFLLLATALSPD